MERANRGRLAAAVEGCSRDRNLPTRIPVWRTVSRSGRPPIAPQSGQGEGDAKGRPDRDPFFGPSGETPPADVRPPAGSAAEDDAFRGCEPKRPVDTLSFAAALRGK